MILSKVKNQNGFVFVYVLMIVVVLTALSAGFIIRALNFGRIVRQQQSYVQSGYLAEAAVMQGLVEFLNQMKRVEGPVAQEGDGFFQDRIKDCLDFGKCLEFFVKMTKPADWEYHSDDERAVYESDEIGLGAGSYRYTLQLTPGRTPFKLAEHHWLFPYVFQVTGRGMVSEMKQALVWKGEAVFHVDEKPSPDGQSADTVDPRPTFSVYAQIPEETLVLQPGSSKALR